MAPSAWSWGLRRYWLSTGVDSLHAKQTQYRFGVKKTPNFPHQSGVPDKDLGLPEGVLLGVNALGQEDGLDPFTRVTLPVGPGGLSQHLVAEQELEEREKIHR